VEREAVGGPCQTPAQAPALEHDHAHGLAARGADARALRYAATLSAVVLIAEVVGGWIAGSLALLADAGHMATDVGALALSLFALRLAERAPTKARTYGWLRTEILAALANGVTLAGVSVYVAIEAVRRLAEPPPVRGGLMLAVAALGLAANLVAGVFLWRGRRRSLNLRAAFLHVVGDAVGSLGALVAALLIALLGWRLADPLVALGVSVLILVSAWRLLRESIDVLMEATPAHVELDRLEQAMRRVPGVLRVGDLHVWTLTSGYHAMSAHVDVEGERAPTPILERLQRLAREEFGISHTTFQLEPVEAQEPPAAPPGAPARR
jgi:cobalt-zinc-cadmium efflux system protein